MDDAGKGLAQTQAAWKIAISSEDVLTKLILWFRALRLHTIEQFSYTKSFNIDQRTFSYDIRFEFVWNIRLRSSNTFNNRISATSDQNMENAICQRRFLCFAAHVQHRLFLLGGLRVSDRRQTGDDRKCIYIDT